MYVSSYYNELLSICKYKSNHMKLFKFTFLLLFIFFHLPIAGQENPNEVLGILMNEKNGLKPVSIFL